MSQNTRTISLVKTSKGSLVPLNNESIQLMKEVNMASNLLDIDYLPVLELAGRRKRLTVEVLPFKPILDNFLAKVERAWQSVKGRKLLLLKRELKFVSTNTVENKKALDKLNDCLAEFFARWGFSYNPVCSEDKKGKKIKLGVTYAFNPNKTPVIPLVDVNNNKIVVELLQFGFTRIQISLNQRREAPGLSTPGAPRVYAKVGTPFHVLEVLVQAGSNWEVVHTSTFGDHELKDLGPLIETLTSLHNKNKTIGGARKFT